MHPIDHAGPPIAKGIFTVLFIWFTGGLGIHMYRQWRFRRRLDKFLAEMTARTIARINQRDQEN